MKKYDLVALKKMEVALSEMCDKVYDFQRNVEYLRTGNNIADAVRKSEYLNKVAELVFDESAHVYDAVEDFLNSMYDDVCDGKVPSLGYYNIKFRFIGIFYEKFQRNPTNYASAMNNIKLFSNLAGIVQEAMYDIVVGRECEE